MLRYKNNIGGIIISIYKITNTFNNKRYIGQTKQDIKRRLSQHLSMSNGCRRLHEAVLEFGKEYFKIELIDQAETIQEAYRKEVNWIDRENTIYPNGYNLLRGGFINGHSEDTKLQMSKTRKGKHPDWATQASTSEEARKKRSQSHLKLGSSVWTEERRNNAKKGAQERAIAVMDNFGIEYPSISEAARLTGCQNESVRLIVLGKQKKTKNKDGIIYFFREIM